MKWNYESCKKEAAKYKTNAEFKRMAGGAYSSACKNKWLNDINQHFIKYKPKGYWTFEKCKIEALKYTYKKDFAKYSRQAYTNACKNNWICEICTHMVEILKPSGYWTFEKCKIEALKYTNRSAFNKFSKSAYDKARLKKWLCDICNHMKPLGNIGKRLIYAAIFTDNYVYIGLTYNLDNRSHEHMNNKKCAIYKHIKKNKSNTNFHSIN